VSDTPRTNSQSGWGMTYRGRSSSEELYVDPRGPFVHSQFARQLERELNAANERIKRLEEAGDAMFIRSTRVGREIWTKAKEDKP
jgi:hypothetical protein